VEIRDAADDVDRPLWETGEEPVLASAQCILLATRSDLDSEVEIEVHVGAGVDDPVAGQLLFDGELLTTGQGILVGNSLTGLHHVGLPIGWHPIRIHAGPPATPPGSPSCSSSGQPAATRSPHSCWSSANKLGPAGDSNPQ